MNELTTLSNKENLENLLKAYKPNIQKSLPSEKYSPDRFMLLLKKACAENPSIYSCSVNSVFGSYMTAVQLGLEPNTPTGYAYLIPRRNNAKGTVDLNFQVGYQGLLELMYRSGTIKSVAAEVVYKQDEFDYEFGTEARLRHVPHPGAKTDQDIEYAYAIADTVNGGKPFVVMTREDIERIRKATSKADTKFSPWNSWYPEMCKKTVLKRLIKLLPKSVEMSKAVDVDSKSEAGITGKYDEELGEVVFDETGNTKHADVLWETVDNATTPKEIEDAKKQIARVKEQGLLDTKEIEELNKLLEKKNGQSN